MRTRGRTDPEEGTDEVKGNKQIGLWHSEAFFAGPQESVKAGDLGRGQPGDKLGSSVDRRRV